MLITFIKQFNRSVKLRVYDWLSIPRLIRKNMSSTMEGGMNIYYIIVDINNCIIDIKNRHC